MENLEGRNVYLGMKKVKVQFLNPDSEMLFYMLQLQWMKHLTHLSTATFTFEGDGMMAKRFQIIAVKRLGSLLVMEILVGEYLCFCTECKCSAHLC